MAHDLPEGVSWHPGTCMWRADLIINGKSIYLGGRETIAEASALYQECLAKAAAKK
jgi:hypothetical protein